MVQVNRPRERTFRGKKKSYSIRFPEDLYDYFSKVADDSGLGIADVISGVLDEVATDWMIEQKEKATTEHKEGEKQ